MKRRLTALLLCVFALLSPVCRAENSVLDGLTQVFARAKEDAIVEKAIRTLTDYWKTEVYAGAYEGVSEDGYLEIKWTRVVYIRDDTAEERFQNMKYYVEFFLLSDYYDTAPYYENVGVFDCVTVTRDGQYAVVNNPIRQYRAITYNFDYTPIIQSVSDRGSDFNRVFTLKK